MRLTLTIFMRHFLGFVAIAGISCFSPTHASSVVKITALESPAWIQHDGYKSKLERNSEINTGDHVITGETGSVEMLLWSDVKLRLATNSDIGILTGKSDGVANPGKLKELYVHKGRACIYYNSQTGTGSKLNINIGNAMAAKILYQGYICVSREDGLSSVRLRSGSVQITHSVDPNIIILSKSGTEFRIDDDGVYELAFPETDDPFKFANKDFLITETDGEIESTGVVDSDITVTDKEKGSEQGPDLIAKDETSPYIYTVYLFSTRSKDTAQQVNEKFLKADYETQIVVSETDSVIRYRIVVSGFSSLQAATEFSESIVGKYGVSDTWIGKDKKKDQGE